MRSSFGDQVEELYKDELGITQKEFAARCRMPRERLCSMMQMHCNYASSRQTGPNVWKYLLKIVKGFACGNPVVFTSRAEADALIALWERNPHTKLSDEKKQRLNEALDNLFPAEKGSFAKPRQALPATDKEQLQQLIDEVIQTSDNNSSTSTAHHLAVERLVTFLKEKLL